MRQHWTCKRRIPKSCGGVGHNGNIGRAKWVRLSVRKQRRAEKHGTDPKDLPHRVALLRQYLTADSGEEP